MSLPLGEGLDIPEPGKISGKNLQIDPFGADFS
jgi:hypothetical protein